MKIITHPVHTPYEAMFAAATGYEISSVHFDRTPAAWVERFRSKPDNVKIIEPEAINWRDYDCCIVHNEAGFEFFRECPLPMIWKEHTMRPRFTPCEAWRERVSKFVFNHKEAATRWILPYCNSKAVVEHWIDADVFQAHRRANNKVLVVGNSVAARGDKGWQVVQELSGLFEILLLGSGNDGLAAVVDVAEPPTFAELLQTYRDCAVYLNPSPLISMAVMEVLMTGIPVVTLDPYNLTDLLEHGQSAMICRNEREIPAMLTWMFENFEASIMMGLAARRACMKRFTKERFAATWNWILEGVVGR